MLLRPYQNTAIEDVLNAWNQGARNVLLVSPTGSGKTHTKTEIVRRLGVKTMCIAHRQELILQISESLAQAKIRHNIIAPKQVVGFCAKRHVQRFGQSYCLGGDVTVASVQTLVRRADRYRDLFRKIELWDIDEAHHVLPENQWGSAVDLFPNAIGLGVTATPLRCDGKGLDGVFNNLVVGPSMRDLIDDGYLSDYRIFCPPESIDLDQVRISQSSGEYMRADLDVAVEESRIVGDVVQHYLRIAGGLRGLTFAVNLANARELTDAYNAAGVPAAYVDGGTPDKERMDALDRLARGDLKQIVNVDLFGEGMDCPALEVVTMARPTQSYGLYCQQFGRALRTSEGKDRAIIIDHVSNVIRHGLPDRPRHWSLEAPRRRREADPDAITMTVCDSCMQPREAFIKACPWCGNVNTPQERGAPEHVHGDLFELDPAVLAQMRQEVIDLDSHPAIPYGANPAIVGRRNRDHRELIEAQTSLRDAIASVAGIWKHFDGLSDPEIHRKFYLTLGTDVLSAQALRARDAEALEKRIRELMNGGKYGAGPDQIGRAS